MLSPLPKDPPIFNKELRTEGNPAHIDKEEMKQSFNEITGGKIISEYESVNKFTARPKTAGRVRRVPMLIPWEPLKGKPPYKPA